MSWAEDENLDAWDGGEFRHTKSLGKVTQVHETDLAILYQDARGKFWVPKVLMEDGEVDIRFRKRYIHNPWVQLLEEEDAYRASRC